jgi:hypothetical protein
MSGLVANSAGLVQERWADDFSIGSGLVLDVVAGVFLFGTSGIIAYFAVWRIHTGGVSISGRRHCISIDCSVEALLISDLRKNISIFFQMHRTYHIIIYFLKFLLTYSKCPASMTDENECTNSSKSFSVTSLRFPRGAWGVMGSSSSIVADIEDVCKLE